MKYRLISLILLLTGSFASFNVMADESQVTRKERNLMVEANEFFKSKNYEKAIECYNMILEINPSNERARYNLAVAMVKRADEIGGAGGNDRNVSPVNAGASDSLNLSSGLMQNANKIFNDLYANSSDKELRERSVYNSGNIFFNDNELQKSIDQYKNALRLNPANNSARHNLRVAQLRLQQNNNGQNQDDKQNQDQKDKDKDKQDQQNKDQQDQQQQNQDQDKKDGQQQPQQPQQPQQGTPQQQNPNYENILNAAQQNESKTRRRLEKQQVPVSNRYHNKPW